MSERERVTRLVDRREPDSIKIARIEEAVGGIREDVAEIKAALKTYDHRTTYLEDVRVRGLEDREVRRKAVEEERARAADAARKAAEEAAAQVATQKSQHISTRQFWIGTVAIVLATMLAALIASGHLF